MTRTETAKWLERKKKARTVVVSDVDTLAGCNGGVEWDEANAQARQPVDARMPAKALRKFVLHERDESSNRISM